jgi:hypothetical protein
MEARERRGRRDLIVAGDLAGHLVLLVTVEGGGGIR